MSKRKIMVVDDSKMLLEWTKDVLEAAGYGVLTAESVWIEHILDLYHPDLVLMDVAVRDEDGAEATRALKARSELGDTKIVLYSSKSETELADLSRRANADGYMKKIDDPDEFAAGVRRFLDS